MSHTHRTAVEWVFAILAPWSISPHPNFREEVVGPAAELALITEQRFFERERYEVTATVGWQRELVDAAKASLTSEGQLSGAGELWTLATQRSLPLGARVAAAAYASLALAEMEQASEAADRLLGMLEEVSGVEPELASNDVRVAVSALAQQALARLIDSCRFDEARSTVGSMSSWIPKAKGVWLDEVEISRGLAWPVTRVRREVSEHLRSVRVATSAFLEQFDGQSWVNVVRHRPGWIQYKNNVASAQADDALVEFQFERKYESTSGKQRFGYSPVWVRAYEGLLLAELSGDVNRIASQREHLGLMHLLTGEDREFSSSEALRLLRQSRSTGELQTALRWMRDEGPSQAIVSDARAVMDRAVREKYATEADLVLLDHAADFLKPKELARAMQVCDVFLGTERVSGRLDWSLRDRAFRTLARLLPESGQDGSVAAETLRFVVDSVSWAHLESAVAAVVEAIEWARVAPPIKGEWRKWAVSEQSAVEVPDLAGRVLEALDSQTSVEVGQSPSLQNAAQLADRGPDDAPQSVVRSNAVAIIRALDEESANAHKGTYALGGISPANVGVAFATRYPDAELWGALEGFLNDITIDGVLKELALDRIANNAALLPKGVLARFGPVAARLVETPKRNSFLPSNNLSIFPEALRAAGALRSLPDQSFIDAVIQLGSQGDTGKLEAARSIAYGIRPGDHTWATVLLLQLAVDNNPAVRAEAGFSLVQLPPQTGLRELREDRVNVLLRSDGVRVAARTLLGLRRVVEREPDLVLRHLVTIKSLARSDRPRVVRHIAEDLLGRLASDRV